MADSILSFGMLTARAFWITRRRVGLDAGSGPLDFTAMVMSLAMRANCFAMRFHRANIVALRTSKIRPMGQWCSQSGMFVYWRKLPASCSRRLGLGKPCARTQPHGSQGRGTQGPGGRRPRVARPGGRLRQLGVQDPHAAPLHAQAALDFLQPLLEVRVLPVLDHGALFLFEPLFLHFGPVGDGREEGVVLVGDALAQVLDLRVPAALMKLGELLLRTPELHRQQRAL